MMHVLNVSPNTTFTIILVVVYLVILIIILRKMNHYIVKVNLKLNYKKVNLLYNTYIKFYKFPIDCTGSNCKTCPSDNCT